VEQSLEANCGSKPKLLMRYETANEVESEVLVQKCREKGNGVFGFGEKVKGLRLKMDLWR